MTNKSSKNRKSFIHFLILKLNIGIITRMFFKIPKYKKDVWWNQSVHMKSEKYPQVFDASKQYIECEIGKEVKMGETNFGYDVLYRVVKIWKERGSDWLYDSDAINCNLQFSKLLKQK